MFSLFIGLILLGIQWSPVYLDNTADTKRLDENQGDTELGTLRRRISSGTRPYSLSRSPLDYHYSPKPKHLKTPRLLRILGSSFDPFWMSVEKPAENDTNSHLSALSQDLFDGASRYRRKLTQEAQNINFASLKLPAELSANSSHVVLDELRRWLVQRASCKLTSTWVDLGPVFWPRWVKGSPTRPDNSGTGKIGTGIIRVRVLVCFCGTSVRHTCAARVPTGYHTHRAGDSSRDKRCPPHVVLKPPFISSLQQRLL
ncbi:unnamed protein product [Ranitomeya imitator]|uniref:Noggin n=1 Tax=Ranitomeya imitator TaxID=111125 RepID=A0ABN9KTB2_9NEOB|nr:unnamed protein product [Ranitomeya imitator]